MERHAVRCIAAAVLTSGLLLGGCAGLPQADVRTITPTRAGQTYQGMPIAMGVDTRAVVSTDVRETSRALAATFVGERGIGAPGLRITRSEPEQNLVVATSAGDPEPYVDCGRFWTA
ncbi:MAG TPA: hypothetical protein VK943_14855, partial [Arenibaculum sp.]|nr:hypothetical protein [Arenibaculum sp.]